MVLRDLRKELRSGERSLKPGRDSAQRLAQRQGIHELEINPGQHNLKEERLGRLGARAEHAVRVIQRFEDSDPGRSPPADLGRPALPSSRPVRYMDGRNNNWFAAPPETRHL